MASEIKEEAGSCNNIDAETQILNIRRIIQYQKSLYYSSSSSSSSSSSAGASCSSFSYPRKSNSLLELMKEGSTSLRRLFDMEHTSLENYFKDYSGSPIIKPILLWGSDTDDGLDHHHHHHHPYWMSIKQTRSMVDSRSHSQTWMASVEDVTNVLPRPSKRRLTRTKSFRRLPPRFRFWICGGFRFRLRLLRRLRIIIRGRKF